MYFYDKSHILARHFHYSLLQVLAIRPQILFPVRYILRTRMDSLIIFFIYFVHFHLYTRMHSLSNEAISANFWATLKGGLPSFPNYPVLFITHTVSSWQLGAARLGKYIIDHERGQHCYFPPC